MDHSDSCFNPLAIRFDRSGWRLSYPPIISYSGDNSFDSADHWTTSCLALLAVIALGNIGSVRS